MINMKMYYVKYSNEHTITITMLDDMEQRFSLHIMVYNVPIYLFFGENDIFYYLLKNLCMSHIMKFLLYIFYIFFVNKCLMFFD